MPQNETPPQDPQPTKRSLSRFFWPTLALLGGLILLGGALRAYACIHNTENRIYCSSPFPWEGEDLVVRQVKGWWKSAKNDDRMALRSNLYPIAQVKLGECRGNGLLVLTFHDELGRQIGDPAHFPYRDGKFTRREAAWIRAEEDQAMARIETGFDNEDALLLQQLQPHTPLWSIRLRYRTEEERALRALGTISIAPEEQKTEE